MASYINDIKPLEDAGDTDAEILAALQADTRHFKNILATGSQDGSDLLHILASKFKVIRLGSDATWKGELITYINSLVEDHPLRVAFEELLSNLQITNRVVFCGDDSETGAAVTSIAAVVDNMVAQRDGHSTGEVFAAVHAVTNGPRYADLTLESIAQLRADYEAEQAGVLRVDSLEALKAEIENDFINPAISDGSSTVEQVKAAIKAGL